MVTVNLDALVSERPFLRTTANLPGNKDDAITLRLRSVWSSFPGTMQLLPVRRREAMYALHAFAARSKTSRPAKHPAR